MNNYALTIENIEKGVPELLEKAGYTQERAFAKNREVSSYCVSLGAMEAIMEKYHNSRKKI